MPFSTALAVMYGARENGTTTRVVSRSIFSRRSSAPENGTTVPYTLRKMRQRQHKKVVQREQEMNLTKKDPRSRRWRMIKSFKSLRSVRKSF
nr:hypothetical protein [Tanacetum cinerariifolium]